MTEPTPWYMRVDWTRDLAPFIGPLTAEETEFEAQYPVPPGYDTPEYHAYEQAMYAEEVGAATRLHRCYLCYLEQTGHPVSTDDDGPLRGVVREGTHRTHPTHPEADRYTTYTLTCGHTII